MRMAQQFEAMGRVLAPFVDEALPDGGIDVAQSRWQKPGRGSAPKAARPDLRYMRALAEALYGATALTDNPTYRQFAEARAHYMARFANEGEPTWLFGVALETLGLHCRHHGPDPDLAEAAQRIVGWARQRKVEIEVGEGVSYGHFPCGYACLKEADDAGWTNDLSIFGSGLVFAYEVTGDESILDDAASFAEYFLQPWWPGALGTDGLWHAGTWREDMDTWVIGPLHYSGFESTDAHGDEASWVFSTFSCIDYLAHLYRYRPDPRIPERCTRAAQCTFDNCQFEDGAVGICGRDDKWLGTTGYAISQVAALKRIVSDQDTLPPLLARAKLSYDYLCDRLPTAQLDEHGVEWVNRTTMADPLVNVGWLWLAALVGLLDGDKLWP